MRGDRPRPRWHAQRQVGRGRGPGRRLGPAPITYVATGCGRTARTRRWPSASPPTGPRRPASWVTVEAGGDLVGALRSYPDGTLLVDALGTWVAAHRDLAVDVDCPRRRAAGPDRADGRGVSEEVGLAVHAPTEAGRRFADVMGTLNQAVAAVADEVLLVVAGRVLSLPPPVTCLT